MPGSAFGSQLMSFGTCHPTLPCPPAGFGASRGNDQIPGILAEGLVDLFRTPRNGLDVEYRSRFQSGVF